MPRAEPGPLRGPRGPQAQRRTRPAWSRLQAYGASGGFRPVWLPGPGLLPRRPGDPGCGQPRAWEEVASAYQPLERTRGPRSRGHDAPKLGRGGAAGSLRPPSLRPDARPTPWVREPTAWAGCRGQLLADDKPERARERAGAEPQRLSGSRTRGRGVALAAFLRACTVALPQNRGGQPCQKTMPADQAGYTGFSQGPVGLSHLMCPPHPHPPPSTYTQFSGRVRLESQNQTPRPGRGGCLQPGTRGG